MRCNESHDWAVAWHGTMLPSNRTASWRAASRARIRPLRRLRLTLRDATDMGTTMTHWARVTVLVLATSGCKDPSAVEGPAAADPAATPPAGSTDRTAATAPRDDDDGGGFFFKRKKPPIPAGTGEAGGSIEPHAGGLGGLTRELIESARRTVGDPVRLVPDAAQYVMRMRPPVLLGHPDAQAVLAKVESTDPRLEAVTSAVRACLGTLDALDDVVLGFDDAKHVVLAAHAKGLGTEATWRCLERESVARGRSLELVITGTARGEGPQLRSSDGDDVGYFADDDTMVMVSTSWDADVQARLRGEGTAAVEGGLAGTMARIHQDDPLWLAGRIAGLAELGLADSPMAGIDDVAVDLRLEGVDLLVTTSVDAGEAADATRVRDDLQRKVDEFKAVIPALGLPATLGTKLAFVAAGDVVTLELSLTGDELRSMRETIERTF